MSVSSGPNPVISRSISSMSGIPSTDSTVITYPSIIAKFCALMGLVALSAAAAWVVIPRPSGLILIAALVAASVLCIIAQTQLARNNLTVGIPLALSGAVLEGALIGIISRSFAEMFGMEIIQHALVGTGGAFAAAIAFSLTPLGKKIGRSLRIFLIALVGYLCLAVLNIVLAFMGIGDGWGIAGLGAFGLLFCLVAVALAAWSVTVDIVAIQDNVDRPGPPGISWALALGLTVSLIWLYLEILRLLGAARR